MPPTRRARKVGLKRIDAALDALRPMGFPDPLVRRTVRNLLKEYGGDDGWTFIEEYSYKLLIDSIIEEAEKSERENNEPKLLENGPLKHGIMQDEPGTRLPSPCGHSMEDLSPHIHSPSPIATMPYPLEVDGPHERLKEEVHSPQVHFCEDYSTHINCQPNMDIVPCSLKEEASHVKLGRQFPSLQTCFLKDEASHTKHEKQFLSLHASSAGVHSAQLCSPPPVDSLPLRQRRPCYGWLSSDDEEEPELVYLLPPA